MDIDPEFNIEDGVAAVMTATLTATSAIRPDIPEYLLRAKICAVNLKALANVVLMADDPESDVELDLKQVVLGLFSTADWLEPSDDLFKDVK